MSDVALNKKSKTPIIMFLVFVLPVVLAYLALTFDWFNKASTNKGELISPPLDISSVLDEREPLWRLLFVMPEECSQGCENALYSMNQIWIALGKDSDRVEPLVLTQQNSAKIENTETQRHPNIRVLKTDSQNVNEVFKDGAANGIFIVDTLGNVILKYPLKQQQEDAIQQSRDILADLRKLLKLSRIG
ncbi:hypothetical protein [Aliiglaciecola lipolytica]|uniref:Transmembrane cytochrome oxidase associated protein n=1 Tax=Aliiglaciecola lipolytica E3 TaxID=1127673 RepID=K6X6T6_9ALTE|nr:hypothetical protein [Aliiglaciecola lipolytica]GAC16299.1 hypothetical protein GLIP_3688 [Aliiglaciecola lipolytica E3]